MSSRAIQNPDKRVWALSGSPALRSSGFVLAISLAVVLPTFIWGIPSNLDLSNHFRFTLPFYDAIANGHLYPGWLAESNSGYGDPSFRFYPPALYYVLAAARSLFGNWYEATVAVFALLSITGGLGMYFWANSILRDSRAAWVSFFYALAPYHINQLYQAVMLAEWAGAAILPFCFAMVERVCERGKPRDVAGLAVAYGILVFTHLPLAIIGSLALLVYALVRIGGPGKLAILTKLAAAVVLGLAASAIYWVTMVFELRWIAVNDVEPLASVDYRLNFLLSTLSPDNLNVWWMNILTLMTLLLCAPALLLLFRRDAVAVRRVARPVIILTAFAVFMSLPLSRPIWNVFPALQETQFPWRWLILFSMGMSLLAAAALPLLTEISIRIKRLVILGAMAISIAFTLSHVVREAQYLSPQRFENTLTEVRGTASVNYWIPIWARSNPRTMSSEVEAAERIVNVTSWQPQHRQFSVGAGPATEVRVKTFYYPHWIATSQTKILPTRPDSDGALLISMPENATSVDLKFREPSRTRVSFLMSCAGIFLVGALAIPRHWRLRR
jgi:uncharacterized membrane protein